MEDPGFVEPRGIQRHFERGGDVLGLHRGAQLPGDDVAGKVVEDRREVEPSPANDLEISEVRLPELVWCRRLILELVRGFHHDEGWAGDQIAGLEEPIDRRLREKIAFGIGKAHGQFPRGQRGLIQRQPDDALANIVGNAVPDAIRLRMSIVQGFRPAGLVQIVPAVEGGTRNADLFQRPPHWQGRLLDEPDDLKLLGGGIPHVASSPSAVKDLRREASALKEVVAELTLENRLLKKSVRGRGPGRIASQSLLPCLEKVFRPDVIEVLDDPLAAAELGDTVLAAQAFQYNADLVFR